MNFICPLCAESYPEVPEFLQHMKIVHIEPHEKLKASIGHADNATASPEVRAEPTLHMECDSEEDGGPTSANNLTSQSEEEFTEDQPQTPVSNSPVEPAEPENFVTQCHLCATSFRSRNYLADHVKIVHEGVQPHGCDQCDKRFSTKSNRNTHVRVVHMKLKPFKCSGCEKTFGQKINGMVHIESKCPGAYIMANEEPARVPTSENNNDPSHEDITIQGDPEVETIKVREEASRDLNKEQKSVLAEAKLHIRKVYNPAGERVHACKLCSKSFTHGHVAVTHVKGVHLKFRPFVCHVCGRQFGQKVNLQSHLLTVHDQTKKPFECAHCPKSYVSQKFLDFHLAVQHNVRRIPAMCEVCGKGYGHKYALSAHRRRVHNLGR